MVQHQERGRIQMTGLIDWEMSGFYPEDLEWVKALNNLSPILLDMTMGICFSRNASLQGTTSRAGMQIWCRTPTSLDRGSFTVDLRTIECGKSLAM